MATYRIRVGRRHKVQPGFIVGAIANEGGLSRGDFGHIDIRGDHSLVELPADLSDQVFERLRHTRVSGQLIELRRDDSDPSEVDGPVGANGSTVPRAGRKAKPVGKPGPITAKREKFAAKPEKKRHRKGQSGVR